jgi:hypothetical protein
MTPNSLQGREMKNKMPRADKTATNTHKQQHARTCTCIYIDELPVSTDIRIKLIDNDKRARSPPPAIKHKQHLFHQCIQYKVSRTNDVVELFVS